MSIQWWQSVNGRPLAQGDLLPKCLLPVFAAPQATDDPEDAQDIDVLTQRLIVGTQSCDLENEKVKFVALCPVHTLDEFAVQNPHFQKLKNWESVRKGQVQALHMMACPDFPETNTRSVVVDFGHIVSLPIDYLEHHAASLGNRWRLDSPFLEHHSQAFARFFMRVGLPSGIAQFT
ncbi:MAG: hypothetical protein WKF77_07005 [Planctomycetaceae bacterium]